MKKLFLFDMDGTITPARKRMDYNMVSHLSFLQKNGWDIGIITGSDMNYVKQQCNILFDLSPVDCSAIHFLPCNGTKYYKNFKKVWEYSMVEELGMKVIKDLMKTLLYCQQNLIGLYPEVPLTGNFIQMRGPVLNWCPIGRNASDEQRKEWVKLDNKRHVRETFLLDLREKIEKEKITVKLGGETSFDIYPKGWNKTFPIEKIPFTAYNKVYFAGDRCFENGNDEELFNLLQEKKDCMSFSVAGPKETIKLIKETINGVTVNEERRNQ